MPRYILIDCKHKKSDKEEHFSYENFNELKEDVIKALDSKGWNNKHKVNVGSIESCLQYLYGKKYENIRYICTSSFNKFTKYNYIKGAIKNKT